MEALADQLRRRYRNGKIWRQNVVYDEGKGDEAAMTEVCLTNGSASISDWDFNRDIESLIATEPEEAPLTVTEDRFAERYRDDLTGEIDWDEIRDTLHEEKFNDYDTKIKAGNAKGCIKRFLFDVSVGDTVLLNTTRGTVFGVYTGESVYDPDNEHADVDPAHVFRRPVRFVREDGEVVFFDNSQLPAPLKPNRLTITEVKREDLKTLLTHAEALSTLAGTSALVSD